MAKYRVGVIGCTGIGTQHASGLVGLDNAELVAGCDLSQEALDKFKDRWAAEWPEVALYTDYRQMLQQAALDIVTVATSDHRHADLVVAAAEAGVKGIFCEKPLATNLADADRMIEAVERNKVILSVDHTRRWFPLWIHTKELVDQGVIGPVQNIISTLNGPRAMLFRNGTHLIDAICYFAASTPEWVFAELESGYEDYTEYCGDGGHEPKTEPSAHGYIHFANGVRAFYVGGPKTTPSGGGVEIVGTEGRILIRDKGSATLFKGDQIETIEPPSWPVEAIPAGMQELVRVVDQGGEPSAPGRTGLTVVEIIMGFLESQRRGNVRVNLPLARN
jgi:UDP-N-acetyl-2-amino-2-deoxyglucuronate dehydrogenase